MLNDRDIKSYPPNYRKNIESVVFGKGFGACLMFVGLVMLQFSSIFGVIVTVIGCGIFLFCFSEEKKCRQSESEDINTEIYYNRVGKLIEKHNTKHPDKGI